jgi:hypothetical protein
MSDPEKLRDSKSPAELTQAEPGVASAEQGQIILDGPDGIAITMTIEAASGTAASLLRAVDEANAQNASQRDPEGAE